MRNKHGQALIEFILVLPILLLIVFAFVDFARIIVCQNHLEGVMNEVSVLDNNEISNYLQNDDEYHITYDIKMEEYRIITLTTKLDLITPGLKNILHNPYVVKVERSIVYE